MQRKIVIIIFCLFSFSFAKTQKIFYSEKEKNQYDWMGSYIIGKVKNNVVVLKYLLPGKRFEILIYDYNMHLKKTIKLDFFLPGNLYRVDFINRGNVFDAITQFYTSKKFYCKIARFNEEGQLVQPITVIDSSAVKNPNGDEVYDVIESEDGQQLSLLHALIGVKPNCLQLDYLLIDNTLRIIKRKQNLVPFNSSIQLSPFYLDNGSNLLFAEFLPTTNNLNSLVIYKIQRDNDTALNSVQFIGNNIPVGITIKINNVNQQYLVNGLFERRINPDTFMTARCTQGIYSCLFNKDLRMQGNDTLFQLQQMNGVRTIITNQALFINNIIHNNDGGYYITCTSTIIPDFSVTSIARAPSSILNSNEKPFYIQPNNSSAVRLNENTLNQPTNPIYYDPARATNSNYNLSETEIKNIKIENQSCNKLFLLYINYENQLQWRLVLDDHDEPQNSIISICKGINTKNLHFVYAGVINKKKNIIGEIVVTQKGGYKFKHLISNDFQYDLKIASGVQIDEKSIVFPCKANNRLAFARIEFD